MIACTSLAWGNIAALVQRNVKRILAYSSVSHAGFMLIAIAAASPLGERALIYYLIPYCGDVARRVRGRRGARARAGRAGDAARISRASAGSGRSSASSMWIFMLGLLGFPLTGGFIGKFYVFAAAYEHGWWWLIVAGVIATIDLGLLLPRDRARDVLPRQPRSCSSRRRAARRRASCCSASASRSASSSRSARSSPCSR